MVLRKRRPITKVGQFGDARSSWVRVNNAEWISYIYTELGAVDDETGEYVSYLAEGIPEIKLTLRIGSRKGMTLSLTGLRLDELDALQEFLNTEFDRARPLVTELDRIAEEAFQDGNDSYTRLYRPVPVIHRRERAQLEHGKGVRSGPPGTPGGDGGDASGPAGGTGGSLADSREEALGTQDDVQEGDVDQGVGEVGGEAGLLGELPVAGPGAS